MKKTVALVLASVALAGVAAALAQNDPQPGQAVSPPAAAPSADTPAPLPTEAVAPPTTPVGPPPNAVLELRALDKMTGKASVINAPLNKPVKFATLTITARTCYSTPPSETPETSAFLQIDDDRPDQSHRRAFSGWMYASSPGLNALQHPLYDVWVISCMTKSPGQLPSVVASAPVKAVSPNAGANEAMPTLPEDAGQ
ncbi:hypothetical protein FHS83_002698 [Rhizomicrobium palustre]|uniref:DUF2155 domain-containing protein n=1 Tax=Rhizomicrobium palustre TaxID=189966 RepID=A0A846N2R2_9PROT|nr:DUF2155 domain-containing protein [Rhizomicrobium palustre]NIK89380.1 hypothetical protein [Rhizomicrobium palustre]